MLAKQPFYERARFDFGYRRFPNIKSPLIAEEASIFSQAFIKHPESDSNLESSLVLFCFQSSV